MKALSPSSSSCIHCNNNRRQKQQKRKRLSITTTSTTARMRTSATNTTATTAAKTMLTLFLLSNLITQSSSSTLVRRRPNNIIDETVIEQTELMKNIQSAKSSTANSNNERRRLRSTSHTNNDNNNLLLHNNEHHHRSLQGMCPPPGHPLYEKCMAHQQQQSGGGGAGPPGGGGPGGGPQQPPGNQYVYLDDPSSGGSPISPELLHPSYQKSLYPYLPNHTKKTCINDRPPQSWEISIASETLLTCCNTHFGWDTHTCLHQGMTIYNATIAELEYKQQLGPTPSPTREVYPFLPNFKDESCYNDIPLPSGNNKVQSYNTLKQCCGSNFKHVMSTCLTTGQAALDKKQTIYNAIDLGLNKYMANWSTQTCERKKGEAWDETFDLLEDCCFVNFDWKLDDCLGIVPPIDNNEEGNDDEEDDTTGLTEKEEPIYWYPIWSESHCINTLDSTSTPPEYMLNDPINQMWRTYRECCTSNYQNDQWSHAQNEEGVATCLVRSAPLAPPTKPPSINNDNTENSGGGDLSYYYYPSYTTSKCLLNANDALSFMKNDPLTYFTLNKVDCCNTHFPEVKGSCINLSPEVPLGSPYYNNYDGTNGGTNGEVNPTHYKFHYYPNLRQTSCIKNTALNAPSYMYDDVQSFFFLNYKECCSWNYEIDYRVCLDKSEKLDLGLTLDDDDNGDGNGNGGGGPAIIIKFQSKLYFRNVYIPTSTQHLLIIRNVILEATKVTIGEKYRVVYMDGINFDGLSIVGIDEEMMRRRRRNRRQLRGGTTGGSIKGLVVESSESMTDTVIDNEQQDAPSSSSSDVVVSPRRRRELLPARMQMFQFDLWVSYPCDEGCMSDINAAGRSESFEITYLFDDAIADGSIFATIATDMESMGYPGPFNGADLVDGILQYEDVTMDAMYTAAPTVSPKPTSRPTTSRPTARPTSTMQQASSALYPYYPDLGSKTCLADGKHSEWQVHLYNSFDECVSLY